MKMSLISLAAIVHLLSFSMQQTMITLTLIDFDDDKINQNILGNLDLRSQERLRQTCSHWGKIADKRTSFQNLFALLHSDLCSTKEVQSRALFAAVYRDECDLAEIILKKNLAGCKLDYPTFSANDVYDPYDIAYGEHMIALLEEYKYHIRKYGQFNEFPKRGIRKDLLILSIIGDNASISTILNVKNPETRAKLINANEVLLPFFLDTLKEACNIAMHNEDINSFLPLIAFMSSGVCAEQLGIDKVFMKACKDKKKNLLEPLLQNKREINEVFDIIWNKKDCYITFRDMIFGTNWEPQIDLKDTDYCNEVALLLNKYGAKTYKELKIERQELEIERQEFQKNL